MFLMIYPKKEVPKKDKERLLEQVQTTRAKNARWSDQSPLLIATCVRQNLGTAMAELLALDWIESVNVSAEMNEGSFAHLSPAQWARLTELRSQDGNLTPAERKEILMLLELESLEICYRGSERWSGMWSEISATQIKMLHHLELLCTKRENEVTGEK